MESVRWLCSLAELVGPLDVRLVEGLWWVSARWAVSQFAVAHVFLALTQICFVPSVLADAWLHVVRAKAAATSQGNRLESGSDWRRVVPVGLRKRQMEAVIQYYSHRSFSSKYSWVVSRASWYHVRWSQKEWNILLVELPCMLVDMRISYRVGLWSFRSCLLARKWLLRQVKRTHDSSAIWFSCNRIHVFERQMKSTCSRVGFCFGFWNLTHRLPYYKWESLHFHRSLLCEHKLANGDNTASFAKNSMFNWPILLLAILTKLGRWKVEWARPSSLPELFCLEGVPPILPVTKSCAG